MPGQNIISLKKFVNKKRIYPLSERAIIFTISATIALPMVVTLVNVFMNVKIWDSVVLLGTYYLVLMAALYFSLRRIRSRMLLIPLLFLGLGLISFIMYPENRDLLIDQFFIPFFTEGLPLFFITLVVNDYNRLYKALRIASIAAIVSAFIFVILQYDGDYEIEYMTFSYGVALPVMLMLVFALEDKKVVDFIIAFLGFAIIFIVGARGPIVGSLTGLLFYFLSNFKLNIKNAFPMIFLSLLILFFAINFEKSMQSLDNFLMQKNISSRTIHLLLNNSIEHNSGRSDLYADAIIDTKNLFIGSGMAGDRVLLGGTYAHNLFLEILLEYGLILGFIFIVMLLNNLIRSLFTRNKSILYYLFFAIFFTTGFMKLQFSSSYTLEPTFYMMLALAIRLALNNKSQEIKMKHGSQHI